MGLYLCVFDGDEELKGVDVGSYSDFDFFRSCVTKILEDGVAGSKFPTFINHPDSDGEWSPAECETLKVELLAIAESFRRLPGIQFRAEWQREVGDSLGLEPSSFYESFIDVDGEMLLERLIHLCDVAIDRHCPILFQ